MTRTDARRERHDEGAHPDESAREALLRLIGLPYPELDAAVRDGTFARLQAEAEREKRQWRRVEE